MKRRAPPNEKSPETSSGLTSKFKLLLNYYPIGCWSKVAANNQRIDGIIHNRYRGIRHSNNANRSHYNGPDREHDLPWCFRSI